ncbi:MAG: hypothetical protein HC801_10815 [Nitrospira sp.]|nr:hypothetical protein [Nitrospira sp.]
MNDLTHRKTTNWIGAHVALTATLEGQEKFENAGVTVALATVSWSVPTSKAFNSYLHTIGLLAESFPTVLPNVNFHWRDEIDPATVSVSAQVIVNGTAFALGPALSYYKVKRPNPEFSAARTGNIQILNNNALWFGNLEPGNEGVTFVANFAGYQNEGSWDVVQIVEFTTTHITSPSGCLYVTGSGVDGGFPYYSKEFTATGTGITAWDSPWERLPPNTTEVERTDGFRMWLMFQPLVARGCQSKRLTGIGVLLLCERQAIFG